MYIGNQWLELLEINQLQLYESIYVMNYYNIINVNLLYQLSTYIEDDLDLRYLFNTL